MITLAETRAKPICYHRLRISWQGEVTTIDLPKNAALFHRKRRRLFFYPSGVSGENIKPIPDEWLNVGKIEIYGIWTIRDDGMRISQWQIDPA